MGASIYIADDEKNIRDLITKFLESDGYSVTPHLKPVTSLWRNSLKNRVNL